MTPEYIIIHHSLTKDGKVLDWQAIRRYHTLTLGWKDIGYQYGIEKVDGTYEILKGRMDTTTGAHCKQSGMNRKSIGICLVGNFDQHTPDIEMMYLLTRLTRSLMEIHNIPVENVFPHNRFATYKTCPGEKFDFDHFIQGLNDGNHHSHGGRR